MNAISETFTRHHKLCDDSWAEAEEAASQGRWPEATAALGRFLAAMRAHLGIEEEALFPAFEQATGMVGGPTAVMRMEHQQMRALVAEARGALGAGSLEQFLGATETLMILVQQHNMKEEQMLYPMCDRALGEGAAAVIGRIEGG